MITLNDFILKYHGATIDYDKRYGGQCVDLYRQYAQECLGFPQSPPVLSAKDIWTNYLPQYYTRIPNGPNNFPLPGDVLIWDGRYGPHGHVAVNLYASRMRILDFSQNDPLGTVCHIQHHSYFGVIGWLRPKSNVMPYAQLAEGHALKGVHSPADPGAWAYTQEVIDVIHDTHMESVFVLCPEITPEIVSDIRAQGVKFVAARLFAHMQESRGSTLEQRARWFCNEVKQSALSLYYSGVSYFQVHNEPNLVIEGLGMNWNNGTEYALWHNMVVNILLPDMPNAKFGFPGLSPGGTIAGVRQDSATFFAQAQIATVSADWLGLHAYWTEGESEQKAIGEIDTFAKAHPNKNVLVTEFSNASKSDSKQLKGEQYERFYTLAKSLTPNVGALFSFVIASTEGFEHETWIEKNGTRSDIVTVLAD